MRQEAALVFSVVLALSACGGESGGDAGSGDPDAGAIRDGGSADAGRDADTDTDGGGPAPVDSGTDASLPPASCEAGRIRIQEVCSPPLVPCGGAVVGEWCYADVCIEKNDLLEEALSQPGVPDACTANAIEIRSSSGTIDGTITLTDTTITRSITSSATGKFYLPAECMIVNCRATQGALDAALGENGSAICTSQPPGCECDITFLSTVDDSSAYTLSGGSILTTSGTGSRRFDYCIEPDGSMRFEEVAASGGEPGVQTALPVSGG